MPVQIIVIPSTALVLDAVQAPGDASVIALRQAVSAALTGRVLGRRVVVVAVDPAVVAADSEGDEDVAGAARQLLPERGVVHLGGLGMPDVQGRVSDEPLGALEAVAAHPGADLAVLALRVCAVADGAPVAAPVPALVGVRGAHAAGAAATQSLAIADVLHQLALGDAVTVVCAGDLAAGHGPKPPRPQVDSAAAAGFEAEVWRSLDDPEALGALTRTAGMVAARGLPALLVAAHLARLADQVVRSLVPTQVDGVGGVVAVYG